MPSPLSIYIHWPFCKSKCPYCDFNSHVRDRVEHGQWRAALLKELDYYAALLPEREVVSIFFGGGTPSLMEPETVEALIGRASQHWRMSADIEITLEANPTSVEAAKLQGFRQAGVNRASLGVQALNAADLAFLGRQHNVTEALEAVRLAGAIFPRMTFDLIYARPEQTLESWEQELTQALTMAKGHMSLYQLTIEENTAFAAAQRRGELPTLDEDTAADMYSLTQAIMQQRGMPAYETSNHAVVGQESRHNLTYWRGDDYIGIGPGAHGRYGMQGRYIATENIKSPERWLEKVEALGQGAEAVIPVEAEERMREMVMMGLRLTSGIDFDDWKRRTGLELQRVIDLMAWQNLRQEGYVQEGETRICITEKGALMLNSIIGRLLA